MVEELNVRLSAAFFVAIKSALFKISSQLSVFLLVEDKADLINLHKQASRIFVIRWGKGGNVWSDVTSQKLWNIY